MNDIQPEFDRSRIPFERYAVDLRMYGNRVTEQEAEEFLVAMWEYQKAVIDWTLDAVNKVALTTPEDAGKKISAAMDLAVERGYEIERLKLEVLKKNKSKILQMHHQKIEELARQAPRFKTGGSKGKINYRAFERDVLKKEFPNGLEGRKFRGDGKYAKKLMSRPKSK